MFGICNLSIVPVRTGASEKSELCTQLLFGDAYKVTDDSEDAKGWIKIECVDDQYTGWISQVQHNAVDHIKFEQYILSDKTICYDDVSSVENKEGNALITLGSTLNLHGRRITLGEQEYLYEGGMYESLEASLESLKFVALRYMNAPYLWGGKTLFGIDCSGLVQQIYKFFNYKLKRDAWQQAEQGHAEIEIEGVKTGDLAFFENEAGRIVHVGMVLESGKIIHAHGKVRIDILDEKGIYNLSTKKYSHKLTLVKRIIPGTNEDGSFNI